MKSTKYLLIGGGLASHNAATRIRQLDPDGSIVMVGREFEPPYNRPPLTKEYMQGKISRDRVFLETRDYYTQHNIETLFGKSVEQLDAKEKVVTLDDRTQIRFEKALLATGGTPVHLGLRGIQQTNVFYFRTLEDALQVSAEAAPGSRAVIIGAGFIGMELAASLTLRGVEVSVIQKAPQLWSRFTNQKLAQFFQDYCAERGVRFHLSEEVMELQGQGQVSAVELKSGGAIPCDFVCVAVGIQPNVQLAEQAGLKVDNGVVCNEYLQSSDPDIYAAGDILNYPDPYFDTRRRVEHWGQADYTGALAGGNMAGERKKYDLLTYVWSDIFDLHLEFGGDEREYDRMLIRGRLGDESFSVIYLKNDVMTAYFAINASKVEYQTLGKIIESRRNLKGNEEHMEDPSFDLKNLLEPAHV